MVVRQMTAIVKADNTYPVKVRKTPKGEVITSLAQGSQVEILEQEDDWSHIRYSEGEGYMMSKFLKLSDVPIDFKEIKNKLNEALKLIDAYVRSNDK